MWLLHEKYGFGYLLENGNYGMKFKDGSIIFLTEENEKIITLKS